MDLMLEGNGNNHVLVVSAKKISSKDFLLSLLHLLWKKMIPEIFKELILSQVLQFILQSFLEALSPLLRLALVVLEFVQEL